MSITSKQKFDLKRFIKELEPFRGRHTELVSVYIPAGYDINKINTHLAQEQGTATNIKSASTRKNVIDALEKMIQHLKLFPKTPENGLVVFSGNVAEREGQQDFKVWSLEPPMPLNTRIYRCDKRFVLELLQDMLEDKEVYGLVVMDRREADIALLSGKSIKPLSSAKSNVPGKTKAGGQSAARYMRLREDAAKDFYKKVGEMVKDEFFEKDNLKGIIVGGPGPTKYDFVDGNFITNELKKKIIGIKDISYTGQFGLQELLERSDDLLAEEEVINEKKIMNRFFDTLAKKPGMVSYGYDEVKKNLENGTVEVVLVSDTVDDNIVEELEEDAKKTGSAVQIISTETREGVQLRDIGKFAAILRYDVSI
ncbi:peptide chain release factor aRF-1 [Candidatus Woesearchaeota archaeon]|nr:peptide chain release factor aRF-1 [Candidatus Woesearchaeota archaeon]